MTSSVETGVVSIIVLILSYLLSPRLSQLRAVASYLGHRRPDTNYEGRVPEARDIASALRESNSRILIVYGSQTGTAEHYARLFGRDCKDKFGESCLIIDPDDYDFDNLHLLPTDKLVVFLIATHGEGEPTENATGLLEYLRDRALDESAPGLINLRYAIFCLGNKTYEHFCAAGRQVDEYLGSCGAVRVNEQGQGDADRDIEEDYEAWKELLMTHMSEVMGFQTVAKQSKSEFRIQELSPGSFESQELGEVQMASPLPRSDNIINAENPYSAPIVKSRELFIAGDRSCILVEFDLKDTGMQYQAGDHLGLCPINPEAEVLRILRVLGLESKSDTIVSIQSLNSDRCKVPFPTPIAYSLIFRHHLDISAPVTRHMCGRLAEFAPEGSISARTLRRWASDKEIFANEIGCRRLTFSQLLLHANAEDYERDPLDSKLHITSWQIPLEWIITSIPRLQPRFYSISSSPRVCKTTVQITAVVLRYLPELSFDLEHPTFLFGTATNYLLQMHLASAKNSLINESRYIDVPRYHLPYTPVQAAHHGIPVFIRSSSFHLPADPTVPVIMIGPGTGVAPFRSFLQDRMASLHDSSAEPHFIESFGQMLLFYGCRSRDTDFLYAHDWEAAASAMHGRFKMYTAFSRSKQQPRRYVMDLLREQSETLKHLVIEQQAMVYICGSTKMARDVKTTLNEILSTDDIGSRTIVDLLQRQDRLRMDVW